MSGKSYVAVLLAVISLFGCAGLQPTPYSGKAVPRIRVLLQEGPEIRLETKGRYVLKINHRSLFPLPKKREVVFRIPEKKGGIEVRMGSKRVLVEAAALTVAGRSGDRFRWQDTPFRGDAVLQRAGRRLRLVNLLGLEDYLKGVVAAELGKRGKKEFEALKAQAVAARTFALAKLRRPGAPNRSFDLRADQADQVYKGSGLEYRRASMAVEATTGEVIVFRDSLIQVFFHSTCGGRTESGGNVFPGADLPYLQGVADNFGNGDFCKDSPYYRWMESVTFEEMRNMLKSFASSQGMSVPDLPITNIFVAKRYTSGRVQDLVLLFGNGSDSITLHGNSVRQAVRRADGRPLPSTLFKLLKFGPKGHPEGVLIVGAGNGHGVGMCQWGAVGMARQGFNYRQILQHYFRGTKVKKVY